jgi:hypothetical protein
MKNSSFYEIRIKDHLNDTIASWFEDLTVSNQEDGETVLSGSLPDQAALQGVLNRISSLGLTLVSVNSVQEED